MLQLVKEVDLTLTMPLAVDSQSDTELLHLVKNKFFNSFYKIIIKDKHLFKKISTGPSCVLVTYHLAAIALTV